MSDSSTLPTAPISPTAVPGDISPRRIEHPGPCNEPAVQTLASRCLTIHETLGRGQTLLDAFAGLLRKYQVSSAVAQLGKGTVFPVKYVFPALSTDPNYAVYYSDVYTANAPLQLTQGAVTVGLKDQAPWLHCHARWLDDKDCLHCGHWLPEQTILSSDIPVELTLLFDATFEICPDDHTHFSLFKPTSTRWSEVSDKPSSPRFFDSNAVNGYLVRVAPNIDFGLALIAACEQHGLTQAKVLGGVGSVVGAIFEDGRTVEPFVTELLVKSGHIDLTTQRAVLDISLIDYTGVVTEGRLAQGKNPVLVTCELVLVAA